MPLEGNYLVCAHKKQCSCYSRGRLLKLIAMVWAIKMNLTRNILSFLCFSMIWRSGYVESYVTLLMLKIFLKTMLYVRDEFNMEVCWWSIESSCKIVRNSITTFEAKHIARSYIKKLRYHGQGWLFQGWLAEPAWLRDSLEKFLEKFLEKRLSAV